MGSGPEHGHSRQSGFTSVQLLNQQEAQRLLITVAVQSGKKSTRGSSKTDKNKKEKKEKEKIEPLYMSKGGESVYEMTWKDRLRGQEMSQH